MPSRTQKLVTLAKKVAARRKARRQIAYLTPEEQIHSGSHSPALGTYILPAPYRVFRLVKR